MRSYKDLFSRLGRLERRGATVVTQVAAVYAPKALFAAFMTGAILPSCGFPRGENLSIVLKDYHTRSGKMRGLVPSTFILQSGHIEYREPTTVRNMNKERNYLGTFVKIAMHAFSCSRVPIETKRGLVGPLCRRCRQSPWLRRCRQRRPEPSRPAAA